MNGKLLFSLFIPLLSGSLWYVHAQSLTVEQAPKAIAEDLSTFSIAGTSFDGHYIYGNTENSGSVFDTQTEKLFTFGNEQNPYEIARVSSDGRVLAMVADEEAGLGFHNHIKVFSLENPESGISIKSSDSEFPYFIVWYASDDLGCFCGSLTNDAWDVKPMVGVLNEKKESYDIIELPVPEKDPLGEIPQQIRLLSISDDGNRTVGGLLDHTGSIATIILYTRQADGSYTFSFPANDLLFDTSIEMPKYPEYDDYVTAPYDPEDPDYDEEKLAEQEAAYDAACEEYDKIFLQFTRFRQLDMFSITVGAKGAVVAGSVVQYRPNEGSDFIYESTKYLTLNLSTHEAKLNDLPAETPDGIIPRDFIGEDNELLLAVPAGMYWDAMVLTPQNTLLGLVEWIKEKTGEDYSDFYRTEDPVEYGKETVFTGWPMMSGDGKTIALMGYSSKTSSRWYNTYIRFGSSILEAPQLEGKGQNPSLRFDGNNLWVEAGISLEIFTPRGERVLYMEPGKSKKGITLRDLLPKGTYIAMAISLKGSRESLKISL